MTDHDPGEVKADARGDNGERWVAPIHQQSDSGRYSSGDYGYGVSSERTLKDYPIILLRHWAVILAMTLIGIVVSLYQTSKTPRLYRSSAMVDIGSYVPALEGPIGASLREETNTGNYRNTQIRLLKSYTLAEKVLSENEQVLRFIDPAGQVVVGEGQPLPVGLLQRYLNTVSFRAIDRTDLVMIFATTTSPGVSATIANAHVRSFINLVKERRQSAANVNFEFLKGKYDEVTAKMQQVEKLRLEHAEKNALGASSNELVEQTFANKYTGLVEKLNDAIFARVAAEAEWKEIRRAKGLGGGGSLGGALSSQLLSLAQQERQYNDLRKQLRGRKNGYLSSLKSSIETTRDSLRSMGRERVKAARSSYKAAAQRERFLRAEFERLHADQLSHGKHKLTQDRLRQEVNSLREVQLSLSKRLEDAMINMESQQETVTLVDKAYAAAHHISPNEMSNLWTGLMMGAMLGVILAFLLDYLDNRVRSVRDLQTVTRTPVLGVVPEFSREAALLSRRVARGRGERSPTEIIERDELIDGPAITAAVDGKVPTLQLGEDSPILPISAPFSVESESFRGILATLTSSPTAPRRILITSGQQGDGKTTLAVNLAATLAQLGEKTLLIDADLRLPNVQSYFGMPKETAGLTNFLTGTNELKELVIKGGIDNLFLLLAGGVSESPATLIRSEKMMKFLDAATDTFDYVIVDSPPIGPVADSLLMAQHVDGVVMVVRSGETSKSVAESAVNRLRQVGANVLGLVLNDTTRMDNYWRSGYRYNKSGSYHSYHYNYHRGR